MNWDSVTIGVNPESVAAYLTKLTNDVTGEAINKLYTSEQELFTVFRQNWEGQSEKAFEANFDTAVHQVVNTIFDLERILWDELSAINDSLLKQDENMVDIKSGGGEN